MTEWRALEADIDVLQGIYRLPEAIAFEVQAVYSHAVYGQLGSDEWVVFLTQDEPIGPSSIRLACERFYGEDWRSGLVTPHGIRVGDRVIRILNVMPHDAHVVVIDGWDHRRIDAMVQRIWGSSDVLSHLDDGPLRLRLVPHLKNLVWGLDHEDMERVTRSVSGLMGRGFGSTPTGDDILLGMLSGYAATHSPRAHRLCHAILEVGDLRRVTTIPSALALSNAVDGKVFSLLNAVIASLSKSGGQGGESVVERLLKRGHTSGRDILAGLVMGSRTIGENWDSWAMTREASRDAVRTETLLGS